MEISDQARDRLSHLLARRLLVVTGKGGVGKTAVAAALGRVLSAAGRRALLLEVDPRESAHRMVGLPPSAGEILSIDTSFYLQNLRPRRVLDRLVVERLRIGALTRRVLDSPVYHHFVEGAPGIKEMGVLGHALELLLREGSVQGPYLDTVILDAPATGHGLALLQAPGLVADVVDSGPFGNLASRLADFVNDQESTGVIIVSQAEEMPVQESLQLKEALEKELRREPDHLIVNGLYPELPEGRQDGEDPVFQLWRQRRKVNEAERQKLLAHWHGPVSELPLLPLPAGPVLVQALAERLVTGQGEAE
jgi:anion-transporting  ArsA/GET3 family ATPase